jgi:uncharacterized protein
VLLAKTDAGAHPDPDTPAVCQKGLSSANPIHRADVGAVFMADRAHRFCRGNRTRVLGIRRPIVMLSILNFFLPPASSIPIVLCVDLCANIFLLPDARHNATAAVTIPLLVGTLLLLPVGVLLLSSANPAIMKRVIALFILIAALALLSEWRPFARPIGVAGWGAVGALTGVIVGATSLGVTAALFLNSGVQSSIAARANFIVWVFFANSALLSMLAASQGLSPDLFSAVAVMAPLYLIGSMAGAKIIHRMPENRARRTILVLIALAGVAGLFL